jgi:hypothetical protein
MDGEALGSMGVEAFTLILIVIIGNNNWFFLGGLSFATNPLRNKKESHLSPLL